MKQIYNPPGQHSKVTVGPGHVRPAKVASTGKGLNYVSAGVEAKVRKGPGVTGGATRRNPASPAAR